MVPLEIFSSLKGIWCSFRNVNSRSHQKQLLKVWALHYREMFGEKPHNGWVGNTKKTFRIWHFIQGFHRVLSAGKVEAQCLKMNCTSTCDVKAKVRSCLWESVCSLWVLTHWKRRQKNGRKSWDAVQQEIPDGKCAKIWINDLCFTCLLLISCCIDEILFLLTLDAID